MSAKSLGKSSGKQSGPSEDRGRRVVFSTDPEDSAPSGKTSGQSSGQSSVSPSAGAANAANPAAPIPTRQQNHPVIVGIERKGRGGKTVSIVSGVMSHPAGKEALLKLLKTKLGTGGTLKDDAIEIQGDHRDPIVEILTGLGYKAKKSGG